MSDYFGHQAHDWERSMMQGMMKDPDTAKTMQDALDNPENYTTARPNMDTDAAFNVGTMVGAGRNGLKKGPSTAYYKIEKPEESAAPPAAVTPEPVEEEVKEEVPVQLSPTAAKAIANVKAYEQEMLPRQGDYIIRGDQSVINDFDTAYELNLRRASTPKTATEQAEEDAVTYRDNYKSAVSDLLEPTPLSF